VHVFCEGLFVELMYVHVTTACASSSIKVTVFQNG
jgi:hypothetical protein